MLKKGADELTYMVVVCCIVVGSYVVVLLFVVVCIGVKRANEAKVKLQLKIQRKNSPKKILISF